MQLKSGQEKEIIIDGIGMWFLRHHIYQLIKIYGPAKVKIGPDYLL